MSCVYEEEDTCHVTFTNVSVHVFNKCVCMCVFARAQSVRACMRVGEQVFEVWVNVWGRASRRAIHA